jgi:opacity protein-like surface antigen
MKVKHLAASVAAVLGAGGIQAHAQQFHGHTIGLEAAYEDYDGAEGETFTVTAGWDIALNPDWVVGAGARLTVDGVEDGQRQLLGVNIATTKVSIEDQWGLTARAGRVIGERVLVFGEVGYEQFHVNAVRDLRAQVCAPPSGCLISRFDGSFDEEMVTFGAGAEWALTDHWRLRGAYTYGDSDAFDRNRFALSAAFRF